MWRGSAVHFNGEKVCSTWHDRHFCRQLVTWRQDISSDVSSAACGALTTGDKLANDEVHSCVLTQWPTPEHMSSHTWRHNPSTSFISDKDDSTTKVVHLTSLNSTCLATKLKQHTKFTIVKSRINNQNSVIHLPSNKYDKAASNNNIRRFAVRNIIKDSLLNIYSKS